MISTIGEFPTETLILHKPCGDIYEVKCLVDSSKVHCDDTSVPIEQDDYFERKLPNGIIEYYKVIDPGFYKGMLGIPDHYQTKVERISGPVLYEKQCDKKRPHMIFISHSSKDKEYTDAFVNLLFDMGLNEDDIVCSSYTGLGVPLGESIYKWLVEKFQKYDLHVLYFLSSNYYKSVACLNEMGAAWAMKQKWDGVLLPGFSFQEITGCIDSTQIIIQLNDDTDELKHRLGELKDDVVNEFELRPISPTRWEKIRDKFIATIQKIPSAIGRQQEADNLQPSVIHKADMTIYAWVMLMYAAASDGEIIVVSSLSGTSYQAGNYSMERSQNPRELAVWGDAVNQLQAKNYIKEVSTNTIYQVTHQGYTVADIFIKQNKVDTSKKPADILMEFSEG